MIAHTSFQLLDACVNNCGKEFRLEVASREFETEFRRLLSRSQPKVQEKLRGVLKSWAEGEFKGDSQLNLIPSMYATLKKEGVDFSSTSDPPKKSQSLPKDPNVVSSQQEEDDIARAIQLSLQDSKGCVHSVPNLNSPLHTVLKLRKFVLTLFQQKFLEMKVTNVFSTFLVKVAFSLY